MKQLEPVIKRKTSFSILLLRDDSKVVSLRLTPIWVKFLVLFFVIFSGLSGAAGYAAHYYWKKYHTLQRERSEMAEILGENRRQLGRFAGIEKIKETSLPRSAMAGVNTMAPGPADAEHNDAASSLAHAPSGQSAPGDTLPATPQAAPPEPAPVPRSEPRAEAISQGNAISPEETITASGPPGSGQEMSQTQDEHPALVDQVQIKSAGDNRFRLSFDLSNRNQDLTLNGRIRLAVATTNGARHEITEVSRDSLRFIINRYKKVSTVFSLPDDIRAADADVLYVTVTADDVPDVTYRFSFPEP